jgi:hypothetical protein
MIPIAFILVIGAGLSGILASYKRRSLIIAPYTRLPSPALNSVLLVDMAGGLLLLLIRFSSPPGRVLLIVPVVMLICYSMVSVLMLWIRPQWRRSTLFILGAFAPIFGCLLAFLIHFSEPKK